MIRIIKFLGDCWEVSDRGTIQNPGMFEGEPVEILYWHDAMMNGMSDTVGCGEDCDVSLDDADHECDPVCDMFEIDDDDRDAIARQLGVQIDPLIKLCFLRYQGAGFVQLEYSAPCPQALSDPPEEDHASRAASLDTTCLSVQDYQDALDVQSGCNLSGIVQAFARVIPRIWDDARLSKAGTEFVNRHPISRLYAEQIAHLAGAGTCSDVGSYSRASALCQERVKVSQE